MAKIKKAWISPSVSKFVRGTNFSAGDYMFSEGPSVMAKVGKSIVELSKPVLRETFNWKRITESRVISLIGKEIVPNMIKEIVKK